jgi:tetratricopeptide (TPR) repeat protein
MASLAGLPVSVARGWLRELVSAGLVDEHAPGRFALHDLLREYAAELARNCGTQASRRAATRRMLDHYLQTAMAAATLLGQQPFRLAPATSAARVTPEPLADRRAAANWFETEYHVLTAMIALAADLGFDLHACQLAVTVTGAFDQSARWEDLAAYGAIALATAQRSGHREAEAHVQRGLAGAFAGLGRYDDAYVHLQRCLDDFTELKNVSGQAHAHLNLACLLHLMDDCEVAFSHARLACELFERLGNERAGQAAALNTVGWFEASFGNTDDGLAHCQQALALAEEIGNRPVAAVTWDSLGYVRHLLGQREAAISCYQRAAAMFAEMGATSFRAQALISLGDIYEASGDRAAAHDLWQEALEVFELSHHPETERLRAKICTAEQSRSA